MPWQIIIIIRTQLIFTISDLLARAYMPKHGFTAASFISAWFLAFVVLRIAGTLGQLYIFTSVELGKTMALFGAVSIVLANVLGFLVLKEVLSPGAYIGVSLAIVAFIVLAIS